jgi:hypothetical protein
MLLGGWEGTKFRGDGSGTGDVDILKGELLTIEGVATIKVTGNLTIEGITKPVTFPAIMYFKDGMDGTVVMNGTLIIDRTEWGIDYASEKYFEKSGDGTISNDVKLFMKIVAKK